MTKKLNEFQTRMLEFLKLGIESGLRLPITLVLIGRNGSTVVVRYTMTEKGIHGKQLAKAMLDGGVSFPANIFLSDAVADVRRATVAFDGLTIH